MKKVILSLAVLIYSTGSFAACTKADLTGTWAIHIEKGGNNYGVGGGGVDYCTFKIPASGSFKSECDGVDSTIGVITTNKVTGTLTVNSTCHVQGTITTDYNMGGQVMQSIENIDAYISKGKDSMIGRSSTIDSMTNSGRISAANLFLGTKM